MSMQEKSTQSKNCENCIHNNVCPVYDYDNDCFYGDMEYCKGEHYVSKDDVLKRCIEHVIQLLDSKFNS